MTDQERLVLELGVIWRAARDKKEAAAKAFTAAAAAFEGASLSLSVAMDRLRDVDAQNAVALHRLSLSEGGNVELDAIPIPDFGAEDGS